MIAKSDLCRCDVLVGEKTYPEWADHGVVRGKIARR